MSAKCVRIVAVWKVFFFVSLPYNIAKPGGSVLVILNQLENLDNKNYKGECCNSACGACDYQLAIWVTCDGKTANSSCLYGMGKTGVFYNTSLIIFTQNLGNGLRNPLVYNFTSFQGNLGISIQATDSTGSNINNYRRHTPIYPSVYGKKKWTNATLTPNNVGRDSNIKLTYQVFCKQHYYSPSCTVGCIPGANYKCDENTGKKICLNGTLGPNCTCKVNLKYSCDPNTGTRLCYQPWYGEKCDVKCQPKNDKSSGYTCDKTGAKQCSKGWYGKECNETTPTYRRVHSSILSSNEQKTDISTIVSSLKTFKTIMSTSRSSHFLFSTKNSDKQSTSSYFVSNKMRSLSKLTHPIPITSILVMASPITSNMTSSPMTLSHTTAPLMASFMTSSTLTPTLMTSTSSTVTSSILPLHLLSTSTVAEISEPKSISMTIRDRTGAMKHSYSQTSIITTTYPVNLKSISSQAGFTKDKLVGSSMDRTGTSGVTDDRTEIVRYQTEHIRVLTKNAKQQTEITRDQYRLSESVPQITQSVFTRLTPESNTRHLEENTKRSHFHHVITSTKRQDAEPSSSVDNDVISNPTSRDTTMRPGSKEARMSQDVWWIILLPLIAAILLIITAIAVFKRKNRKQRRVSPHYETSMQEFKVKPGDSERKSNEQNNNIAEGDLEAIWKVMSTYHE